jgi:hypothetical protein
MANALTLAIASSLAEWDAPYVELAIFGTADAARIAAEFATLCVSELRSQPVEALFYQSSIGAVAGVELEDGRRVVIKGHQPSVSSARLAEIMRHQSRVESQLGLAPRVLAGPVPFAFGTATVEQFVGHGSIRDGHDRSVRRELARSLLAIVECLFPLYESSRLEPSLLADANRKELWPTPHSELFDFAATTRGAEYIDEIAAKARLRMIPAGPQRDWAWRLARGARPVRR